MQRFVSRALLAGLLAAGAFGATAADAPAPATLTLTSTAFADQAAMPVKYTCEGDNINPPLALGKVPPAAVTLVLIVEDPDATRGTWDHWVMWNLPPTTTEIKENSAPGTVGRNSGGKNRYQGPCPPTGTHRYIFRVYALNARLDLPETADKAQVLQAMAGKVLATGTLTGRYQRQAK